MTEFQLRLTNPFGIVIAYVGMDAIVKLSYVLTTNAVGSLTLTTARDAIPDDWVRQDARLEAWRKPAGGAWGREGSGPFLVQKAIVGVSQREGRYRTIEAVTLNHLLTRRDVRYYAESAQASKTAAADNMMKAIVRENFGSTANSSPLYAGGLSRDWSALMTVAADVGLGPSTSKAFAWRKVLPVLQEIARDAAALLTPVYFDVVMDSTLSEFRTYVNVRGLDRSTAANRLVISPERGSLGGTVESTTDWSDADTWLAAGGQGQTTARTLGQASDTVRARGSPFGVREGWLDATQLSTVASLNAEASAELQRRRPTRTLAGDLISVPGAVYGLDWGFGDKLIAELERESYTARVDSVTVTVEGGRETVKASIKGDAV